MPKRASAGRPDPRELVAEIIRRTGHTHVVRLSDPPTSLQRLQLAAARLLRSPFVIMPTRCDSIEEWLERYAKRQGTS